MTVPDVDVQRSHSRFSSTLLDASGLGSLALGRKRAWERGFGGPGQRAGSKPAAAGRAGSERAASGQQRQRAGRAGYAEMRPGLAANPQNSATLPAASWRTRSSLPAESFTQTCQSRLTVSA